MINLDSSRESITRGFSWYLGHKIWLGLTNFKQQSRHITDKSLLWQGHLKLTVKEKANMKPRFRTFKVTATYGSITIEQAPKLEAQYLACECNDTSSWGPSGFCTWVSFLQDPGWVNGTLGFFPDCSYWIRHKFTSKLPRINTQISPTTDTICYTNCLFICTNKVSILPASFFFVRMRQIAWTWNQLECSLC